jgi:hypothetical protein
MAPNAVRCLYAFRPADRPNCRLTASVTYGTTALCSACDLQRSTLGKGQPGKPLPDTEPEPLGLLTDARRQFIAAREQLNAAVTRARQHHTTWTAIASELGITRQAAQQRFRQRP